MSASFASTLASAGAPCALLLLVTGLLAAAAFAIKRHYRHVSAQLRRLDSLLVSESRAGLRPALQHAPATLAPLDATARTVILLVNGYNRLGLHTALHVPRRFGDTFRNFIFLSVGTVDAGNFKGADELAALRAHTAAEAERYAAWARAHGYAAHARAHGYGAATSTAIGPDITGEVMSLATAARAEFPNSVFFAGQLQFSRETRLTRLLHNHTATVLQHRFFAETLPFVVFPIRRNPPFRRPPDPRERLNFFTVFHQTPKL